MNFPPLSEQELGFLTRSRSLLLVSGGPDSVYLFYWFLNLRQKHAIAFDVVHFNHHLRGAESDRDEAFVRDLCRRFRVCCHVRHLCFKSKAHLQARARQARYAACIRLQQETGAGWIVTAHHRDDALETLIMRKSRGTGLKGLVGIRRRVLFTDPFDHTKTASVFRPLLLFSKKEIVTALENAGLSFCHDSSNETPSYLRNRVRHGVFSSWTLKDETMELARQIEIIDSYFDRRLKFLLRRHSRFVDRADWESWPDELRFRFFESKMHQNGFRHQIETKHYELIQDPEVKLTLGEALFFKDGSGCYFFNRGALEDTATLVTGPGRYYYPPLDIIVAICHGPGHHLEFPLYLRRAQFGEFIHVQGSNRPVPLKKIFRAKGLGRYQRWFWPVLADKEGKIVAVLGLGRSLVNCPLPMANPGPLSSGGWAQGVGSGKRDSSL